MEPKVSILMGVYNCEDTLIESIESIIRQSYTNWELIICDDCSRDNTAAIALDYSINFPDKIKFLRNEENLTLGPTLNRCLKEATGKYIARHDGDDLCDKNKLEIQVKFLKKNKDIDLVGTAMECFDENGVHGIRKLKEAPVGRDLMRGTTFCHATIMMKAQVIKALQGYSENKEARGVEDYDLWFRFFHKGYKGINLQEPLYKVREDRNCYKRKSTKRRVNEIKTMYEGRKLLGLGFTDNKYIVKPMIAAVVPSKLMMEYQKRKMWK
ncbi:glycosyltransferase family 2 protein [Clostridium culturomicium]|uniref:glycosyltransferase family 2 protein n=1 Tax=Clostridium culturomicium TaxID=1499683 RepID=UPI00058CD54A|nr:glycosyltransferase family A protein [Clostridium culturomicium]